MFVRRSSHTKVSYEKSVLKNFAKFIGKHLRRSLYFSKVKGMRPKTLLKKKLRQRRFSENLRNFQKLLFYLTPLMAASV